MYEYIYIYRCVFLESKERERDGHTLYYHKLMYFLLLLQETLEVLEMHGGDIYIYIYISLCFSRE